MEREHRSRLRQLRRAYEWGRFHRAATVAYPVAAIVWASAWATGGGPTLAAMGAGLLLLSLALRWRGGAMGRAVGPGLAVGCIPLAVGALSLGVRHGCSDGSCLVVCTPASAIGGLVAGALLGLHASRQRGHAGVHLGAAATIAALTGALTCVELGGGALLGLGLALSLGTAPAWSLRGGVTHPA